MDQPYEAAPGVHVLPTSLVIPGVGTLVVNAFVLLAEEPVLIDTGIAVDEPAFIDALASIVDPADIRWIWLTHDDTDHTGSLGRVMELAPRSRLITHALGALRMGTWWPIPLDRVDAVAIGDDISVGDRVLTAVRPPLYDNPMTTGFLDRSTGYFFCADSFGAIIGETTHSVAEIPEEALIGGMTAWATFDSPWTQIVDRRAFGLELDRVELLGCSALFPSHLPPADGGDLPRLRKVIEAVPDAEPFVAPSREAFAEIVAQMAAAGAPT